MPLKAAIWVHGNIVKAEYPGRLTRLEDVEDTAYRRGWGVEFRVRHQGGFPSPIVPPNDRNWFHIPFSNPVILDDIRPRLQKTFVFYKAGLALITALHIYDGPRIVKAFNDLSLTGDHSSGIDADNSWVIDPPITIYYGLGFSVGVQFLQDNPSDPVNPFGSILFTTAGADLHT
jgi:hypothetical protein